MDNFPKPNVLPREQNDEQDARALSEILPVILEQNGYEKVYNRTAYDYISDGGCITGVFWDNSKNDGMGDIAIKQVDIHNIFWKPGINDIQESPEVFTVAVVDNEELIKQYPQMEGKAGNQLTKAEYIHDDYIKNDDISYVVDWYYKKTVLEPVMTDPETGDSLMRPKTVLHYCKFCNGEVLYASENNKDMEEGFYNHGKFPFVFDVLFPVKDTPWGFGYIDVMKNPQMYIDALDQMITKNAFMVGNPRFWVREDAGVNLEALSDFSKPYVSFAGGNVEDVIKKIDVPTIPAFVVNHKTNKTEELKETSGNRDFSQGSTQSGVTAASAIAALQEAGSKLSRDMIRNRYTGHQEVNYLVIELIRQFYTEARSFRIDGKGGEYKFVDYDNSRIAGEQEDSMRRRPVFDIKVVAEKQSPFSRAAQNETAKELYGLGLFNPQMAEPALVCLDMMEFEGKESIRQQVQQNSILLQQMQAMQQAIMSFDAAYPQLGLAVAAGLTQPQASVAQSAQGSVKKEDGTPEERAAKTESDDTKTSKARTKAARQATVG